MARFNPCCWKKFATQMSAGRNSLCCLKPGPESLSLREQDMKQRNGQTEGERQPLKHKQKNLKSPLKEQDGRCSPQFSMIPSCNTQEQRTVRKGAADGPPEVTPRYLPPCGTRLSYLPPPSTHSVPKRGFVTHASMSPPPLDLPPPAILPRFLA